MNKQGLIVGAIILAALIAIPFVKNQNLMSKLLPTGNVVQDADLPQTQTTTAPEPIKGKPRVEISTSKGKFVIELRPDVAPKTVVNFLSKWNSGYCDAKTFHRVEDWVVQGCDPKGDGTGGLTNLPTETSSESFLEGSVGVARKAFPKDMSNDSQFFIVKNASSFLDGEYTYFGKVVSGMDVIKTLAAGDKILSTSILSK